MQRRRQAELMDDPHVDPVAHAAALAALRRVNRWLGVERHLVSTLDRTLGGGAAKILDIGTGGGGLLRCALRHARRGKLDWRVCGLDRSPFALGQARHSAACNCADYVAADALSLPFADRTFDVVACSLLLHHFDPAEAVSLLREAARVCRRAVVIGDLQRSRLAWGLTWLVTRITSRSHIFHVDGPRSVRAAYRSAEAQTLALQAGLEGCTVGTVFPFRWLLLWRRSGV